MSIDQPTIPSTGARAHHSALHATVAPGIAIVDLIGRLQQTNVSDDTVAFGELLRTSQTVLDLSIEGLARIARVSDGTVRRWISGLASPHATARLAICKALITFADAELTKVRLA